MNINDDDDDEDVCVCGVWGCVERATIYGLRWSWRGLNSYIYMYTKTHTYEHLRSPGNEAINKVGYTSGVTYERVA